MNVLGDLHDLKRVIYVHVQSYNLGHKSWKKSMILDTHFAPPHPCAMLTKHFHLMQVCILPFSNIERENGGVDTYTEGITIMISCLAFLATQFVHGCS